MLNASPPAQEKPPSWEAVRQVFDPVASLAPHEREAALSAAAAGGVEPAVLAEARALLSQLEADEAGQGDRDSFLERPAVGMDQRAEQDLAGQRIGPWRVTELLGQGGMGEVWEACRDDGAYEATVAVKVLRGAVDDTSFRSHFAQEQRLLARLNHPHIARLMDAGHLPDGRPYFVMEAVQGRPLDEAAAGAPLPARLRLFLQLADAVAHAHHQGLVHRDLKPSNVLVTPQGQVKLLDFGIAQALEHGPGAEQGARPLTPGYASPEQVRGETVGPHSDVYALGVLLHVLLTGTRPYGRGATTVAEALRAVLQETPTAPSQSPASSGLDPGVERRRLSGDLDAVVLKALAKQPTDRYPTVQALAEDLRAHLDLRPVAARPRTAWYVGSRFAWRHRGAVTAVALALLALVAGLGLSAWKARDAVAALAVLSLAAGVAVSAWQARQARAARDDARARLAETSGLVRDVVMRYADLVTFLPGGLRMKADLLRDTLAHMERLADGARTDPRLAGEIAKAHARMADILIDGVAGSLVQPEDARRHLESAQALFPLGEAVHRDDPGYWLWWARSLRGRALLARDAGDAPGALSWRQRQRDLIRQALQRCPADFDLRHELASALFGIGSAQGAGRLVASLDNPEAAEAAFAEADSLYLALSQERPTDSTLLHQLGIVAGGRMLLLARLGRLDQAVHQGRRDLDFKEQALAMEPLNVAYRESLAGEASNVVTVLLEAGLVQEALRVSARSEEVITALEADDPQVNTWTDRRRWFAWPRGWALLAAGQAAEALPRLREAMVGMAGATAGRTLARRGACGVALAQALEATGDAPAAVQAARAAQQDLRSAADAGLTQDPQVKAAVEGLAALLSRLGA